MGELGGWSGKDVIRVLVHLGYAVIRQKGSHVRLVHPDAAIRKPVTIPLQKELKKGLLRQVIQDAGLTIKEFKSL